MTIVVALGDSLTCGEGVGVRVPLPATWAALLAQALPAGRLVPRAEPGAKIADVLRRQVPLPPADLVTVLIGLNDVVRPGFHPGRVRSDLLALAGLVAASGSSLLLGRLHDPTRVLPLPPPLVRHVRNRVDQVNAAVDEAAEAVGGQVLDLARVVALKEASGWAVDGVHPSHAGHGAMAAAAAQVLRRAGWPASRIPEPAAERAPTYGERVWWAARHGGPYVVRHLPELGGPVVSALLRGT